MASWWEYIPGATSVASAAKGDWGKAMLGPGSSAFSGAMGSDLFKNDLLPMIGIGQSPEEQQLIQQMQQTSQDYQAYRPELAQARMQGLQQTMSMMDPYNRAMESLYGPGAMPDYSQAFQYPMFGNVQAHTPQPVQAESPGVANNPDRPMVQASRLP